MARARVGQGQLHFGTTWAQLHTQCAADRNTGKIIGPRDGALICSMAIPAFLMHSASPDTVAPGEQETVCVSRSCQRALFRHGIEVVPLALVVQQHFGMTEETSQKNDVVRPRNGRTIGQKHGAQNFR